jgi:ribosome-associated translation inhibitor RaiA
MPHLLAPRLQTCGHMKTPLQITFHDVDHSPALEQAIRERAGRLERFSPRILACRVAVETPHRRRTKGNHFRVRLSVSVPGEEIIVGRDPAQHAAHEDPHVAVRDAFRAARRRLEDYEQVRRGQVK